jgi:uncharacterized delta-60 repeat protein
MRHVLLPGTIGVVLACAASAMPASAAPPAGDFRVTLVRPLAGALAEFAVSAVPLGSDVVLAGYASSSGADDALLLRADAAGEVIWRRTWPGGGDSAIWCLRPVGDGTLAGAGWTKSPAGDLDAMLIRVGADGRVIWQKSYRGPHKERLWSLEVLPQGLVAAGEALAADGTSKMLVLRADLDGNEIARVSPDGAPVERAFSIQAEPDGGYVLAGQSGSGPREGPGYDAKIVRFDSAGKPLWSRTWGGPGFDVGHDLRRLDDGRLLVAGYTEAGSGRGTDVFLLRMSPEGEIVRADTDGGPGDDRAVHLAVLPDGAVAVAGYSRSGSDDWDIVVRVFSPEGPVRSTRRFGGVGNELGRTVVAAADGSLTVVGHSQSYGPLERILLIRLSP